MRSQPIPDPIYTFTVVTNTRRFEVEASHHKGAFNRAIQHLKEHEQIINIYLKRSEPYTPSQAVKVNERLAEIQHQQAMAQRLKR